MSEEEGCAVHHQQVDFPLFHVSYDVFIGEDMDLVKEHIQGLYPGLEMKIASNVAGYTCVVKHEDYGVGLFILLNTGEIPNSPTMLSTIVHECTHLSWHILDGVGVGLDQNNHEVQAYVMEELVREVTRIYAESIHDDEDLDDL